MKINAKEDKWLLISCLQKSIRKGFEKLALSYAEQLYEIDENYLIHRLSIIALEDIGLANIELVQHFLSNENNIDIINERGGKKYILDTIVQFCHSNKDRTVAELTELAKMSPPLKITDTLYLENIFMDENIALINRVLAGWELLGSQKLKNPLISNEEEDIENFLEINSKVVNNKAILEILKNAYLMHREPYYISLGLLSNVFDKEKNEKIGRHITGSIIENSFEQKLINNKWLIDGIDWHTKEGKVAIAQFIDHNPDIVKELKKSGADYKNMSTAIGLLMFRADGHYVNKRIVYPSAVITLKITQQKELQQIIQKEGVDISHLIKIFDDDYPILCDEIENTFKMPDPSSFPF